MSKHTNATYRTAARDEYADEGRIEFDDTPVVSRTGEDGDAGAFVQAWVWVDGEEYYDEEGAEPRTRDADAETVTLDAEDKVELYHMLRGRGGSGLKDKLLVALEGLDPKHAADLRALDA
jgi:hypothetical protein